MSLAFKAMEFARQVHAGQVRKYTGAPYFEHLSEVAGIVSSVAISSSGVIIATSFLHDCVEDQGIEVRELMDRFGSYIANGVMLLSDMEVGNRAERKEASRRRLSGAPAWVQTIKVADLISNTSSIVKHDPDFAKVYLEEKRMLLDVLTLADDRLVKIAREQIGGAE